MESLACMQNFLLVKMILLQAVPLIFLSALCLRQELKMEKKSSDLYVPDDIAKNSGGKGTRNGSPDSIVDEEAPFIPSSRVSHLGRSPLSSYSA